MELTRQSISVKDSVKFWEQVDKRGPDQCWPWKGGVSGGYGSVRIAGTKVGAHRVAFVLAGNEIEPEHRVCHTCAPHDPNEPQRCCNPAHLVELPPGWNV